MRREALLVLAMVVVVSRNLQADLSEGLVGYWAFNGNANDESGGGNHGTVSGATLTTDRFGNPNSAYSFDGTDDYIDIGDIELVSGNTMSVAAWFKTSASLQYAQSIVSKLYNNVAYYLGGAFGKIQFKVNYDTHGLTKSNDALNDGLWHHAVGVYDGTLPSDNIKLYVDGIVQSDTTDYTADINDVPEHITIGSNSGGSGSDDCFEGVIDDIRIYSRALSQVEAAELYNPDGNNILTIRVEPNDVGIDTVIPSVGQHPLFELNIALSATRFMNCPDVYSFDHWVGDVNDPNSANTTVFMDSDKIITAVFVDDRQCGDECHPYPDGDVIKDCVVDFKDIAVVANAWLECTKPECD